MKRFYFLLCTGMMVISAGSFAANTPQTITMDGATDNATAFGADGTLGIDNTCTFYVHWDASYLYVGWSAGRTNYSSDMFYVGIDLVDGLGSNGAIEGVDFSSSTPDFYAVFENNSSFYGAPVGNGNAFEIYQDNGANGWNFVSRTDGNDNVDSKIIFSDGPGEVRFRIAWATLGVTPGASQPLGLTFWNNNPFGNFGWASWPSDNPAGSATPQTMTHKLLYTSTADGTNPSTAGTSVPLATTLPVELFDFSGQFESNGVALTWTAAEELFSHYEVERLSPAGSFEKIDRVAAEGEFGQPTSYQYLDHNAPLGQMLTYRLAMVDMDGSVDYSNKIEVSSAEGVVSISPNPTYGQLTVALPGTPRNPGTIRVMNMQGQTVYSQPLAEGQSVWNLDLSDLASGAYQAVIQWDNQRTVKRFSLY